MDIDQLITRHKRAQAKANEFACPYCTSRLFTNDDILYEHVSSEHSSQLQTLGLQGNVPFFRKLLREEAVHKARSLAKKKSEPPSHSRILSEPAAAMRGLSLGRKTTPPRSKSPPPSHRPEKKHRPGSDANFSSQQRAKTQEPNVTVVDDDTEFNQDNPFTFGNQTSNIVQKRRELFDYQVRSPLTLRADQSQPQVPSEHSDPRRSSGPPPEISSTTTPIAQPSVQRQPGILPAPVDSRWPNLLLQPDSRPISQEQLAAEVKSIYAGLTMVETKCIHVDKAHASTAQNPESPEDAKLAPDHWQALIALHRTLLHEHHDFFLASQHPSASPALRRLAGKYSMPARMWKHGIHSFLELLRHRLPESLDYMLAFIYLAYQMMALLYETVPTFEDTWIECLGDLGRYRMAIEDEDIRDRETWAGVARFWYSKAADKSPNIGRLYHHLAILARPNVLQQLYFYNRALTCEQPFMSARESILTLFDPVLGRSNTTHSHISPVDESFIRLHAFLFERTTKPFASTLAVFLPQLDNHIGRVTAKWKEQGAYVAITNVASLFNYGVPDSALRRIFNEDAQRREQSAQQQPSSPKPSEGVSHKASSQSELEQKDTPKSGRISSPIYEATFPYASRLNFSTARIVLQRIGDKNVLPFVHIFLAFVFRLASIPSEIFDSAVVLDDAPWEEIAVFLNTLVKSEKPDLRFIVEDIFRQDGNNRPLPEDYFVRGQAWAQHLFTKTWFDNAQDEEERSLERASTVKARTDRVMWLGCRLASFGRWLEFDEATKSWQVSPSFKLAQQACVAGVKAEPSADAMDIEYPIKNYPAVMPVSDDKVANLKAFKASSNVPQHDYPVSQNF